MTLGDLGTVMDSRIYDMHLIKVALEGTLDNLNNSAYVLNVDEKYMDYQVVRICPFVEDNGELALGIVIKES